MKSFISWVGGKSRLAPTIVKQFPEHKTYVEVFGGAGWVLFRKDPSPVEVYNDINGDLVNLFRVVKHRPSALVERLNLILYSRESFKEFTGKWKETPTDELERAASFIYTVRSSFGAKPGGGWAYGKTSKPRTVINLDFILEVQERLRNVYIDGQSYAKTIAAFDSPDTLFYLDPPYWIEGEKFYQYDFKPENHQELRNILSGVKGKFLLSYNNSNEVRKLYRKFKVKMTEPIHYSQNNKRKSARMASEVIIRNF